MRKCTIGDLPLGSRFMRLDISHPFFDDGMPKIFIRGDNGIFLRRHDDGNGISVQDYVNHPEPKPAVDIETNVVKCQCIGEVGRDLGTALWRDDVEVLDVTEETALHFERKFG